MAYTAAIDTTNTLLGTSLLEIKDFLGVADTTEDNVITDLINEVSWSFNRECNRLFLQRSVTEYFDGGGRVLWLRNPPVTAVSIYQDSERSFAADTEIDDSDYDVDPTNGRVELIAGIFLSGQRIVKATYTGGYADSAIPLDLRNAAKVRLARLYLLQQSKALGTSSRSDDQGGQTGYQHDPLSIEKAAVMKYLLYRGIA
jgi:hypothetical protein